MKLLAFDTSTEIMSIAVQHGADVYEFTGTGGAQASSRLIPEIQILMQQAGFAFKDLDGIAFGAGPGAFTGLRASCAVAQGLGFAAGVPLLPINTLHAVALIKHLQLLQHVQNPRHPQHAKNAVPAASAGRITAALDARMGEVYWQRFDFSDDALGAPIDPEPQLSKAETQVDGADFELGTLPTAPILLRLAGRMLANGLAVGPADALPLYVRNKVAETTAEREITKAKKEATLLAHASFLLERKANGVVTAFCEVLRGVDEAEILNIETLPSHRRQGLAASLLREALEWAQANKRTSVWLEVRISNAAAIALYTKCGFQTISTRQRYYADGEDALVMKCSVAEKDPRPPHNPL